MSPAELRALHSVNHARRVIIWCLIVSALVLASVASYTLGRIQGDAGPAADDIVEAAIRRASK